MAIVQIDLYNGLKQLTGRAG